MPTATIAFADLKPLAIELRPYQKMAYRFGSIPINHTHERQVARREITEELAESLHPNS